ncbi:MAG: helix-turn-helix domain-containing protein [Clostridia bacterium]|nr:helix-turn-helix domain-containing protein [Clostridia bacterium]
MLLDELAKELVEVTSSLVGGRTINVMDTEGVIVASTEHHRIGTFHQGALEAVQTGKPVNIRRDQLDRYPGAKEGCNMPLRVNGTVIGVVGISGDPEEIRDVAHLLEVFAAKYYQLETMLRPRLAESGLRSQLLTQLLTPGGGNPAAIRGLMEALNVELRFPVTAAVIAVPEIGRSRTEKKLTQLLSDQGFLKKDTDVWGIVKDRMVLLAGDLPDRDVRDLGALAQADPGWRISLGSAVMSVPQIVGSYLQAVTMDAALAGPVNDIRELPTRCGYMLARTGHLEADFLEGLAAKLEETFGPGESRALLLSLRTYYDCDRSVGTAAQKLSIHKNTLQYRVRRVLEVLELTKLPSFWQEYLIRLLIGRMDVA